MILATQKWIFSVTMTVIGLAVFSAFMDHGAESCVPVVQKNCPVLYPLPQKPPSFKPVDSDEIFPLLTYVEARAKRRVTAYNAGDAGQCDDDPCISANGENICLALENGLKRCAANFVPLGTRIWVQGFGECLVTDRMNQRFQHRVDIAMPLGEKEKALEFGMKHLEVKVLSQM
ncbi:MAG: 3D domain-containing protein [Desulfobacter sp.]|nr:3D domain-containing protein [Desulfobacter sp.]